MGAQRGDWRFEGFKFDVAGMVPVLRDAPGRGRVAQGRRGVAWVAIRSDSAGTGIGRHELRGLLHFAAAPALPC